MARLLALLCTLGCLAVAWYHRLASDDDARSGTSADSRDAGAGADFQSRLAVGCGACDGAAWGVTMTPLAAFYARHLPQGLVLPALSATYAAMLLAVLLLGRIPAEAIIYIDLGG